MWTRHGTLSSATFLDRVQAEHHVQARQSCDHTVGSFSTGFAESVRD